MTESAPPSAAQLRAIEPFVRDQLLVLLKSEGLLTREEALAIIGDALKARFLAGFYKSDPTRDGGALGEDFFALEENRLAVLDGLQAWSEHIHDLLPAGVGRALMVAIRKMVLGEETWLRPKETKAGARTKPSTRADFDLAFCQEIAFLRGMFGKDNIAFWEAVQPKADRLRRNKAVLGRKRQTQYPPLTYASYSAYKQACARVRRDPQAAQLLIIAEDAGKRHRLNLPLPPDGSRFVQRRDACLRDHQAPFPPALYCNLGTGDRNG